MSGWRARVHVVMTSARTTAASRSETLSATIPFCVSELATSTARRGVRFQIKTRFSDGRTLRCARASHGDITPAPTTRSVCGSSLAKNFAPRAESAAVRQVVSAVPSSTASGRPFVPSNTTH